MTRGRACSRDRVQQPEPLERHRADRWGQDGEDDREEPELAVGGGEVGLVVYRLVAVDGDKPPEREEEREGLRRRVHPERLTLSAPGPSARRRAPRPPPKVMSNPKPSDMHVGWYVSSTVESKSAMGTVNPKNAHAPTTARSARDLGHNAASASAGSSPMRSRDTGGRAIVSDDACVDQVRTG